MASIDDANRPNGFVSGAERKDQDAMVSARTPSSDRSVAGSSPARASWNFEKMRSTVALDFSQESELPAPWIVFVSAGFFMLAKDELSSNGPGGLLRTGVSGLRMFSIRKFTNFQNRHSNNSSRPFITRATVALFG